MNRKENREYILADNSASFFLNKKGNLSANPGYYIAPKGTKKEVSVSEQAAAISKRQPKGKGTIESALFTPYNIKWIELH